MSPSPLSGEPRPTPLTNLWLPAVLAPLAVVLGAGVGNRFLLPILATVAVYPTLVSLVLRGRAGAAALATILWSVSLSISLIMLTTHDPVAAGHLVINGPEYRDEMFEFVRNGIGTEGDPSRFIPQHLIHLAAFIALSVLSAGLLGILLGAILLGYMSFYVGALAAAGEPLLAFSMGWPPWAIMRVVAYILIGVALSRPLLSLLVRRPIPLLRRRRWYLSAGVLLAGDIVLKAALAPLWGQLLRPCLNAP